MMYALLAFMSVTSLCEAERGVYEEAADRIEAAYVLEAEARRIAEALRDGAASAAPRRECQPKEEFASLFTMDLRALSGDGHFYLEAMKEESGDDWVEEWRASAPGRGYGVERVQVFDGNIGYIRIGSFFELEPAFARYSAAFELVSDTDALILDLHVNHGGSAQTAWPTQWTFLEPGAPTPMRIESRIEPSLLREEPPVLWKRYGAERPLVVLISKNTYSAPEAVAHTLQATGRATIIGEASGGGAHMLDAGKDLKAGFTLYTPTSRPVSTVTGGNWEGDGVAPDIQASSAEALDTALSYLRNHLAAK